VANAMEGRVESIEHRFRDLMHGGCVFKNAFFKIISAFIVNNKATGVARTGMQSFGDISTRGRKGYQRLWAGAKGGGLFSVKGLKNEPLQGAKQHNLRRGGGRHIWRYKKGRAGGVRFRKDLPRGGQAPMKNGHRGTFGG